MKAVNLLSYRFHIYTRNNLYECRSFLRLDQPLWHLHSWKLPCQNQFWSIVRVFICKYRSNLINLLPWLSRIFLLISFFFVHYLLILIFSNDTIVEICSTIFINRINNISNDYFIKFSNLFHTDYYRKTYPNHYYIRLFNRWNNIQWTEFIINTFTIFFT